MDPMFPKVEITHLGHRKALTRNYFRKELCYWTPVDFSSFVKDLVSSINSLSGNLRVLTMEVRVNRFECELKNDVFDSWLAKWAYYWGRTCEIKKLFDLAVYRLIIELIGRNAWLFLNRAHACKRTDIEESIALTGKRTGIIEEPSRLKNLVQVSARNERNNINTERVVNY